MCVCGGGGGGCSSAVRQDHIFQVYELLVYVLLFFLCSCFVDHDAGVHHSRPLDHTGSGVVDRRVCGICGNREVRGVHF